MEPRDTARPAGPGANERHGDANAGDPGPAALRGDAGRAEDGGGRDAGVVVGVGTGLGVQAAVAALLAAAVRVRVDGTEAEADAVAAFRAARDTGAHTAPTRRRDDWRRVDPTP